MKTTIPVLAMLLSIGFLPAAFSVPAVQEEVDSQTNHEISGTIKQVSATVRLVVIETADQLEKTISVEPETKIMVGGKEGTLDDLKEGQFIKAMLHRDTSKAISISVA